MIKKEQAKREICALAIAEIERTHQTFERDPGRAAPPSWDDYVSDVRRVLNTHMDRPEEEL